MRRSLLLLCLLVVGCGTLTNTEFDAIEAKGYSDVAELAHANQPFCNDVVRMRQLSRVMLSQASSIARYSNIKENNLRAARAGEIVQSFAVDFATRYNNGDASEAYCKLKLGIIEQAADIVARSISKKETRAPFVIP